MADLGAIAKSVLYSRRRKYGGGTYKCLFLLIISTLHFIGRDKTAFSVDNSSSDISDVNEVLKSLFFLLSDASYPFSILVSDSCEHFSGDLENDFSCVLFSDVGLRNLGSRSHTAIVPSSSPQHNCKELCGFHDAVVIRVVSDPITFHDDSNTCY